MALVAVLGWLTIGAQDGAFPVERADSTADWLAASAFASGMDPHGDLRELAKTFEISYWPEYDQAVADRTERIPRTPGALVLLYPLSWVTAEQARTLLLAAGLVATAATFLILLGVRHVAPQAVFLGAVLAMVSGPARWSQLFVTQSGIVMLCVAVVLAGINRGHAVRTGFALAIAGSLKVFPLALVVLLVARRRFKALAVTFGMLAVLNLTPFLLPHISVAGAVEAFGLTAASWTDITPGLPGLIAGWTTVGLPLLLFIALAVVTPAVLLVLRCRVPYAVGAVTLLAAALLAMPLSWPHYLLSLIPALVLASREVSPRSVLGAVLGAGALLLLPMTPIVIHTLGLSVILIGVIVTVTLAGQGKSTTRSLPAIATSQI